VSRQDERELWSSEGLIHTGDVLRLLPGRARAKKRNKKSPPPTLSGERPSQKPI